MSDFKKALQYVKDNVERIDVEHAVYHMDKGRCPLRMVNDSLSMKINDLMEEYGEDNDLPEGWWLSECDEDDVIFKLIELYDKEYGQEEKV